jgi:hypothetical protein
VAAAITIFGRLLHHGEIIRLEGRSYRAHERQLRTKSQPLKPLIKETK